MIRKQILFISILVTLFSHSMAQDIKVKAWLDTNRILIGDQVKFNIEISQPRDFELLLTLYNDTIISDIEIIAEYNADTINEGDDRLIINKEYLITSFDTGFYQIPPYQVELRNELGVKRFYSDYVALEVSRTDIIPSDTSAVIFDIIDPRKARLSAAEVFPWALMVLIILVISYFAWRWYRNREKVEVDESQFMPGEPIHIIALRDLDKLEKNQLWQKGSVKKYYSILTEIIRIYIDRRFKVSSLEKTSSETLNLLLKLNCLEKNSLDRLSGLLFTADLSKFAKYIPDNKFNESSIEEARLFVKETTKDENNEPESMQDKEKLEDVNHE